MNRNLRFSFALVLLFFVTLPLATEVPRQASGSFTVLLTNDDGYDAQGLRALVEAFAPIARVVVSAPASEQSGTSGAITYREPIFVREVDLGAGVTAYAVDAKPATCARVGLESLMSEIPDVVISGINSSPNLGIVSYVSGTVGAARQAALLGVPAIAVSRGSGADYATVAAFTRTLVEGLRAAGRLRPGLLLNVNTPAGEWRGVRVVRQSVAADRENYQRGRNPRGRVYYWSDWSPPEDTDDATDVGAFAAGYVVITPFLLDQTNRAELDALGKLELNVMTPAVPGISR